MAARAAVGMSLRRPGASKTNPNSQTPWNTADQRVRAPARTFAELRTITPVMGSAPSVPQIAFPTPWAVNSRSYRVRGPRCI